ncbi:nodulation protein NfeD [Vitiosangium sp. GDMCC 1.1324]|uniref:NfeD family protein n=1 Tax=Vitiosangium sp. (strain GDMCC 1.1324) TaxID=2138576 RepID=UPI000D36DC12|nr:nodulation protein NfeD [Vitiosangium sp. GDMCC 1.1324]PTL81523.1 peptidase S14 [Vitiosangium sp. GDMCC 1.1324]
MGWFWRSVWRLFVLGVLLAGQATGLAQPPAPPVVSRCVLDGMVDAGSSAYLVDCVRRAQQAGHQALLIRLDTPGGELEATRNIVRAFLGSRVPILVWVGPSGARAGSAGVFITLASHLAAMAPGTNIGAAHPIVGLTGQDPEQAGGKELARKIENDTVAFVEAIAKQRGRNAEWAARAVRESESVPAERALALHVIEHVAPTEASFLEWANGRIVTVADTPVTLRTAQAQVVELTPSLSQHVLHLLAQPAVVYILFLLAGLGIAVELSHPGTFAPGIVGVVCLVLALLASSALPVHLGAVLLLLLGVAMLVAELFVTSGLLGAAGTVLLVLGGVFLVDRFNPDWFIDNPMRLSLGMVLPTAIFVAGAAVFLAFRAAQARRMPQLAGDAGLVGEVGQTLEAVSPSGGEVFVHGERWAAVSPTPISRGARVVVRRVEGLTLFVDEVKT